MRLDQIRLDETLMGPVGVVAGGGVSVPRSQKPTKNWERFGQWRWDSKSDERLSSASGSAGVAEGLPTEGDGGPAEADGNQQRHPESAAVPHAEGEGGDQPGVGCPVGQRPAR